MYGSDVVGINGVGSDGVGGDGVGSGVDDSLITVYIKSSRMFVAKSAYRWAGSTRWSPMISWAGPWDVRRTGDLTHILHSQYRERGLIGPNGPVSWMLDSTELSSPMRSR